MNRAQEIAKTIKEFKEGSGEPIEDWSDDLWEALEECIAGIYLEDWNNLAIVDSQPCPIKWIR